MTTATLSLHSQRSSNPGATEESTGQVYAGVDVDTPLNSALRFAPPSDISGATITSVTLTIRAKYSETTGGVLCKFALADNTSNLATQNLASTAETNHDYLHTPTYTSLATPPAGSVEITSTYASYSIDLTATADVTNLEDDVIVLCQYDAFQRFTGSDDTGHITFDGIGETTPASLEIVYTPAATTLNHESTDDDDVTAATASVELIAVSETTDVDDTTLATTFHGIEYTLTHASTDANDTTAATAESSILASLSTTDESDLTTAATSVLVTASHESTDDDDVSLVRTEGFGWVAESETTDQDDTTLATVTLALSAASETTDQDDVSVIFATTASLSATSSTIDQNDVTVAAVSVLVSASHTSTDEDDATVAIATRDSVKKRGFTPRQFRTFNNFQKSVFLGV